MPDDVWLVDLDTNKVSDLYSGAFGFDERGQFSGNPNAHGGFEKCSAHAQVHT